MIMVKEKRKESSWIVNEYYAHTIFILLIVVGAIYIIFDLWHPMGLYFGSVAIIVGLLGSLLLKFWPKILDKWIDLLWWNPYS